ncbi:MAG: hypothetical protein H3C43_11485 [Leptonema sp. (in: Bacteria)]|nr:hypothetical protein [Leptonema sp. (in: bacteria)]
MIISFLVSLTSVAGEKIELLEEKPIPDSYSFGEELPADDLVTWYELEKLATAQNRKVLPDCGLGGFKDDLARWVPLEGLTLTFKPKLKSRVFLYIDFVGMVDRNLELYSIENRCIPAMKETIFDSTKPGPYEWIEVLVNGQRKTIFYQGLDVGFTGPLVVPIGRDEFVNEKIEVTLIPSGRYFAVWDMFLSNSPPTD